MIVFKTLFNKALWLQKRGIELRNTEDMTPLRKYIRKKLSSGRETTRNRRDGTNVKWYDQQLLLTQGYYRPSTFEINRECIACRDRKKAWKCNLLPQQPTNGLANHYNYASKWLFVSTNHYKPILIPLQLLYKVTKHYIVLPAQRYLACERYKE